MKAFENLDDDQMIFLNGKLCFELNKLFLEHQKIVLKFHQQVANPENFHCRVDVAKNLFLKEQMCVERLTNFQKMTFNRKTKRKAI